MTLKDDNSIATLLSPNYNITPSSDVKEDVLKFLFQPKTTKHTSKVTTTHYTILHAIAHYFPEATIYYNHGNKINAFSKVKTMQVICDSSIYNMSKKIRKAWGHVPSIPLDPLKHAT